ncbi:glycerophosphodiester phosphodiesterase family protein [Hymenobacter sp. GOD-10R]|uniref:glycerophosphodiester phosphodiesterase family protein n=1 Tax=Hymenobacter sp. GOD-10R TaxID=3093922 RepID=UPI002D771E38|nr:glycerophosphodiester phosphodiesterase family protein [Hymenobacter sp. GOD-10R]WRQ28585.1 glycerophosphodiester phosphodiesterase family protein [Hymenobacter sp. GOD-10R]
MIRIVDSTNYPEVHGHRGCRGLLPENTVPAFLRALELGVDTLELDVVISADEQVIVSHEPWLSAALCLDASGQPIPLAREKDFNLFQLPYDYIRRCDCGLQRQLRFPEQQLQPAYKPLLREVFQAVEKRTQELTRSLVHYSIEVKSTAGEDHIFHPTPARFVELVIGEVQAAGVMSRTAIISFDKRALQAVHQQAPALTLGLLVEDAKPFHEHLQELGFIPALYGPEFPLVDAQLMAEVRAYSMRLVPWTVNEIADMHRLLALGVDGITTDYPNRLLQILQRS